MPKIKPVVARTPESLARTLGLSAAEAPEWRFQHELLSRLKAVVRREGVTHADLARRAATSRTRVTAILNGDLEHVSSDLLIRLLAALGYRVRAVVSRTAA
jgi:predicted XRE-type DNA-binding protein